jgi:hypothetical protein
MKPGFVAVVCHFTRFGRKRTAGEKEYDGPQRDVTA